MADEQTTAPDPFVVDWPEAVTRLVTQAEDDHDWYAQRAAELLAPADRIAVDIGCGGGGMTLALADAMGATGTVVAVDAEPDLLAALRHRLADRARLVATVACVEADLGSGAAAIRAAVQPGGADLVWASASVHHLGDQQAAINTLASLLAPGGRLALAEGGLATRRLPWDLGIGEPGLEQRLATAHERWFAQMRAQLPGTVRMPYGWTEALRRAGLVRVTTQTTLRERPAPLPEPERRQLAERYARSVARLLPTGYLEPADVTAWQRLTDPADEAWLGRRTDVFSLGARSVHVGVQGSEAMPSPPQRRGV